MDLLNYIKEILDLQATQAVLSWDQETHMPPKGAEGRARASSTLDRVIHRRMSDPRLGELAQRAMESPDELMREIGSYWYETYEDAIRVPEDLSAALAEAGSAGFSAWVDSTNFDEVLPSLDNLVKLNREFAKCYPEHKPYDALIDCFEPGVGQAFINKSFDILKVGLLDIRKQVGPSGSRKQISSNHPSQIELCKKITEWMGYDYSRGNLSLTEHPFMTSFNRSDVRIANKIHQQNPLLTIMGAVHEAGHAIYDQNAGYEDTGLDTLDSMALHESQSLFWEVMIGKSEAFWQKWLPEFNKSLSRKPLSRWLRAPVYQKPSDIISDLRHYDPSNVVRLRAGDLDYGLHIILRYELEREIFDGGLEARDMRDRFNELCLAYFGRYPKDDRREGVLQDCHWPCGLFGYFPSYLLGVSFSAQLRQRMPDTDDPVQILEFLKETIHCHGGRYTFEQLTDRLGGYDPNPYLNYLRSVYMK